MKFCHAEKTVLRSTNTKRNHQKKNVGMNGLRQKIKKSSPSQLTTLRRIARRVSKEIKNSLIVFTLTDLEILPIYLTCGLNTHVDYQNVSVTCVKSLLLV